MQVIPDDIIRKRAVHLRFFDDFFSQLEQDGSAFLLYKEKTLIAPEEREITVKIAALINRVDKRFREINELSPDAGYLFEMEQMKRRGEKKCVRPRYHTGRIVDGKLE